MCGLAAFICFDASTRANTVVQMNEMISHRGPDDEGFVLFDTNTADPLILGGNVTPPECYHSGLPYAPSQSMKGNINKGFKLMMAHRRLSILDVSYTGHQPMCNSEKDVWLVYNGEVYNYVELREVLEQAGFRFYSNTDTEVVLSAYLRWGVDCLKKLNGMFSLVIYDRRKNLVFAARDRFGIKPLYFRVGTSGLAFASEIKQFTVLQDWTPKVENSTLYHFLCQGRVDYSSNTFFDSVKQLRGGQFLTATIPDRGVEDIAQWWENNVKIKQWYNLKPRQFDGSFEEACQQFKQVFEQSLTLHLRSDVPVGSCLSGGLDSSSIVCVMNQLLRGQETSQNTFSAYSEAKRFDESDFVKEVVQKTGVNGYHVVPDLEKLYASLSDLVWHQDEPFGSTSIFAQWQVFQLVASHGVKVVLDGQGADEQLAGYRAFFFAHMAGLFKSGSWFQLYKEISGSRKSERLSTSEAVIGMLNYLLPKIIHKSAANMFDPTFLSPAWLNKRRFDCYGQDLLGALGGRPASIRGLSEIQLLRSSLPMLLHWEDRDSMAHSVESRVPFLNHDLVEMVLGFPAEYLLHKGMTKRVLRASMKGVLPEKVRLRTDKLGFVTAEEIWMRDRNPEYFKTKAVESIDLCGNVFVKDRARKEVFDIIDRKKAFSKLPWRVIVLGEWAKRFGVKF